MATTVTPALPFATLGSLVQAPPATQAPAVATPALGSDTFVSQRPAAAPGTRYVVRPGDHLSKIALEQLGDARRWREVAALNQHRYPSLLAHPEAIKAGWVLTLPAACAPKPQVPPVPVPAVPKPVAPAPAHPGYPVLPGNPNLTGDARLQADLEQFLANPANHEPAVLMRTMREAEAFFVAATPSQKARVMSFLTRDEGTPATRHAIVNLVRMAESRQELLPTLRAAASLRTNARIMHHLGDTPEGIQVAYALGRSNLYREALVWRALDAGSIRSFVRSLGFRQPMIGSSPAVFALPERARQYLGATLTEGSPTLEDRAMASWIAQHGGARTAQPA